MRITDLLDKRSISLDAAPCSKNEALGDGADEDAACEAVSKFMQENL